ncbi:ferredoxin-NADP reductase [Glycomyces artemisiae]|uniref:Ferredoxin-NADP reductase n=1 Tax=Glycomyces artemisiae TaxID=1076443 RepID=A0A2T0USX6_9ACTN|nr:ferredoxin reductase [Glycomyces artemisiae]PRY60947.1 ferredoxin-NADP reductase [Glycomyces artemisiae]
MTGLWQRARLVERRPETATAVTLVFRPENWPGHLAGQHADIRLTADDGYTAVRSYSMAAPVRDGLVEFTVQRVNDGEVSTYLCDDLPVGADVELKGPIGGWFIWRETETRPVLLVAGGSGIVPLQAMIRQRRESGSDVPFRLIYSVRTPADIIYRDELGDAADGVETTILYTRTTPAGSGRPPARISLADLKEHGWTPGFDPACFICGPTGFVETAARALVAMGHDSHRIKTERFG